jgi:hypothetical protein
VGRKLWPSHQPIWRPSKRAEKGAAQCPATAAVTRNQRQTRELLPIKRF